MSFLTKLKQVLNHEMNRSVTENGAVGYRTTGQNLLDLNFAVASLRNAPEQVIIDKFTKAYFDDRTTAVKWLFYVRDIRGGLGERRLFRTVFKHLAVSHPELPVTELISLIPEYGRYDDLLCLLDSEYCDTVISMIKNQLSSDLEAKENGHSISLLAKWLPSVNTSSEASRSRGRLIAKKLGISEKEYRQTLSALRKHLDIVEQKMSAGSFGEIKYEAVPSKANLIYKHAFLRHDEERRTSYLNNLKKGGTKINAGVLYPHEIVHAYLHGFQLQPYNETLEQLWRALKDTTGGIRSTIVVADGSGSMTVPVGGGTCTALSVANALAIYFAERSRGQFKDQYITFSMNPQLVDLSKGGNLREKLQIARAHNEVANTDIHAVFRLILQTAVNNRMAQEEMPGNIIIVSDMEFDSCGKNASQPLFTQIAGEYRRHGYKLPRLVFWNVNSRTGTIPVKENDLGVAIVSGFSSNLFRMVLSNELDPYRNLLEMLNTERYDKIDTVMNKTG